MSDLNTAESNLNSRQVIGKLIGLTRTHRRIIEARTQHTELHLSGHRMLMHISRFENIPSQRELSEHFGISPAAVANLLKRLCADGYIERSKSENGDNRKNKIKITQKGKREIEETREYFDFVDNTMFGGFTEKELSDFVSFMQRAESNLLSIENT